MPAGQAPEGEEVALAADVAVLVEEIPPAVGEPALDVTAPVAGAAAFQISHADPVAAGRLAAALEEIRAVGVPTLNAAIAERVSRVIDLCDEFALPVTSPRAEAERAGGGDGLGDHLAGPARALR